MPFAEAKKSNSFTAELEKEHVIPLTDLGLAKNKPATSKLPEITAQDKPIFLDPKHKEEVEKTFKEGVKSFKEDSSLKSETMKKLEALVYIMRDKEDGFGINYVRYDSPTKPKTAEEVYQSKEGDCDDLSRLYVALAKQLGITNLTQFYVVFKNESTGKEEGHAALFYVDGAVLYIDPAFEKAYIIPTKSKTLNEAIADSQFRKDLEKCQFEARGKKDEWKISEIKAIPGSQSVEAVYCFEMGNYFSGIRDWDNASKYMQAAVEGGMKTFAAYFTFGEANYRLKRYGDAIEALEVANKLNNKDADGYRYLGLAYGKQGRYADVADTFRKQVELDSKDYDAKYNLASSCVRVADDLMKTKEYKKAFELYSESEKVFLSIRGIDSSDIEEIETTLTYIKDMKEEAKGKLSK